MKYDGFVFEVGISRKEMRFVAFPLILTAVFVGLKFTACRAASWWLVFCPLWGPPVVVGVAFFVFILVALIASAFDDDADQDNDQDGNQLIGA